MRESLEGSPRNPARLVSGSHRVARWHLQWTSEFHRLANSGKTHSSNSLAGGPSPYRKHGPSPAGAPTSQDTPRPGSTLPSCRACPPRGSRADRPRNLSPSTTLLSNSPLTPPPPPPHISR